MKGTTAVAGALAATVAVLTIAGIVLIAMNWPRPLTIAEWGFPGFQGLAALVFGAVGMSVAMRRPGNPIGWLMLAAGLSTAVQFVGHQYAIYGLVTAPGTVPLPSVGTWIEEWIWLPILAFVGVFTFLLFPTGRLISARWRVVAVGGAIGAAIGCVGAALARPGRVPGSVNPLAPEGAPAIVEPMAGIGMAILVACLAAASASLFIRYRRSIAAERQQLKWLAFGGLVVGVVFAAYSASVVITGEDRNPMSALLAVAILAIPTTIAVAMLRHGLYEVDRLLNRTLVYGVLSFVLVSLYVASVLALQLVLQTVTGGETVAVAASTLLIASIFQPVRRRVQEAVDRRFFRARYDAQRSLERFGARVRDEVDLDALAETLIREIAVTIRPTTAALWFRRS